MQVSGGRTVFPSLGLAVEPRPGTALLWHNLHVLQCNADWTVPLHCAAGR